MKNNKKPIMYIRISTPNADGTKNTIRKQLKAITQKVATFTQNNAKI